MASIFGKECPSCGYVSHPDAKRCFSCQVKFVGVSPDEHERRASSSNEAGDADSPMTEQSRIEAFVGKNADYYIEKWQSMGEVGGPRISFNWAAFFVAVPWLVYRKLYAQFAILALVIFGVAFVTTYVEDAAIVPTRAIKIWDRLSLLVYGVIVGSLGNYWYLRRFQKISEAAQSGFTDPSAKRGFLENKGGTNPIGALAVVAVSMLLFVIGSILANSFQASKGHLNVLGALLLILSVVFGIVFALQSTRGSRHRYVTVPLLSILYALGLLLASNVIDRPIRHYWYSSVVNQYIKNNTHVSALRDLEPAEFDAFRSQIIAIGKRERLDAPEVYARANEKAGEYILPRAYEYLSNSPDSAALGIARAHSELLKSISERYSSNCENTKFGFSFKHAMTSKSVLGQIGNFDDVLISAIKSGSGVNRVEEPPKLVVDRVINDFMAFYPEYSFMLNPLLQDPRLIRGGDRRLFCKARIDLIDYMLRQPAPVAASFFRRYYK